MSARALRLPAVLALTCMCFVHASAHPNVALARSIKVPAMDTINVGIALSPPKAVFFGPYVADAEGFFKREHLRVHFMSMPNGLETELGTTTGQINYGFSSATDAISSAAAKAPIHLIWSYGPRLDTECIGGRSIHSIKDLIGKNVGSTGSGGFAYTTLDACLKKGGVNVDQVHLINMTRAGFVPALISGRIQAAVFHIDDGLTVMSKDRALHLLDIEYQTEPNWWYGGVTVRDDYARAHQDITRRFLSAMVLADRWMYFHKAAVVDIGTRVSGEDRPIVSKAYDFIVKGHLWTLNSGLSRTQEAYTAKVMLRFGEISALPSYRAVVDATDINQVLREIGTVNENKYP
jgi:ABC-type nitrate/sulfonate/bicarbonate transport system substrate-binding protein